MKNPMFVLATALVSLTVFTSAFAIGEEEGCDCLPDVTYQDNPTTEWPSCVSSFGVSWTSTQTGICDREGCPPPQPCTGTYTISGTGSCSWTVVIGTIGTPAGQASKVNRSGTFTTQPKPYTLDCGSYTSFWFKAEDVLLGVFDLKCNNCDS
jgi:hypothetical protein